MVKLTRFLRIFGRGIGKLNENRTSSRLRLTLDRNRYGFNYIHGIKVTNSNL